MRILYWMVGIGIAAGTGLALQPGCGDNKPGERRCWDALDDEGDGLVDCVDPDCRNNYWCREDAPGWDWLITPSPGFGPTPDPRCNGRPCDTPDSYILGGDFTVVDDGDGDGLFPVTGTFIAYLYNNGDPNDFACDQQAVFSGILDTRTPNDLPCPQSGSGSCSGLFTSIVIDPDDFSTTCNLANPIEFFPIQMMEYYLSRYLLSFPVDYSVGLGDYCNGCTDLTIGDLEPVGGLTDHLVWFGNDDNANGLLDGGDSSFLLGMSVKDNSNGTATPIREAIGEHVFLSFWIFLL